MMQQLAYTISFSWLDQSESSPIITTLGKLIEALNEEVEPEEDYLVAKVVVHLLDAGKIRFLNSRGEIEID
jgi:hypothetical protein